MGASPASPKGPSRPFVILARAISWLCDWSGRVVAVACLAVMFVALLVNVMLRYAFGTGIPWAYEIHAILLPWLVAGGLVIAAAHGRNIAITLLPDILPLAARRWFMIGVQLAILVISVAVVWTSQPVLRASQFQTLSTLGVKQIWGYSSLVFRFAGMDVIRLLARDPLALPKDVPQSLS
jgi:TRAP-type transport system small permease protein